ncbi:28S ribosomal protein S21, mitochondrial [Trichinella sp. T9]|nr:28S ribosomal protein S21, mitochondrial [Trichinella sp. T9]
MNKQFLLYHINMSSLQITLNKVEAEFKVHPFGHPLFRGITRAHQRFINKTVLVKDNNVEEALKILNKKLSQEKLLEIYRRTRYYEKPYQQRNQYSYEICKAIYNEDMNRKIALISRKNRPDRWPGQY